MAVDRDGPWDDGVGDPLLLPGSEPGARSPEPGAVSEWLWVAADGRYMPAGPEKPARDFVVVGGLPSRLVPTVCPDDVVRPVLRQLDFVPDDAPEGQVYYRRVEFVRESDAPSEEERLAFAKHAAEMLFPKEPASG